ncbi:PAS domain-containing sensor histidine kinase [Hymenobacter sp. BT175]|uniref:sensor histidine kinase n=1 Tax=Hymenobacter translucens TaxID=2886507 RepID=UPI001D0DD9F1|nr:PAS domain-containing sensor histidine kinase [Hymenobacter translucens]MCC2548209.1 PAS domain-containing sensor histidine kinase [Hymenobacter translucens]
MREAEEEQYPELDLRLTAENVEELYEYAPCGYCSCLPDGTLVKLNQTLLGWLHYTRTELVAHRTFQELLSIGGRLHYETYCAPLLLLQGEVREISYQLRRRDGSRLSVLLNAQLLRDPLGNPLLVRITLFDITERQKYEQELLRAKSQAEEQGRQLARANEQLIAKNEQLTRINQDLDNFVYTASHDLKQPINNMAGIFEELMRTASFTDPEAPGMVSMFNDALRQMLSTIEDLTVVVQLQREQEHTTVELIELQPFTEELIRSLPARTDARFTLDFAAVPRLHFPRPGLQSILYNLLSNGLKYAHPDRPPHLWVSTALVDGAPVLSVRDNGRGIDLQRHGQELFQLFRRFHSDVPGSGVGLYLVQRLVHQAGGRIEVESQVGEGTTFRLYL